jgi:hypothetical protein
LVASRKLWGIKLKRISFDELFASAQLIWADKGFAQNIALESYNIINSVEKRKVNFFGGKRASSLVGGLFYLLGYRYGKVKKQSEIADKLRTSDVTVRLSYRKWLIEFPDLFVDVIGKLAQHESLKYFILCDLKHVEH